MTWGMYLVSLPFFLSVTSHALNITFGQSAVFSGISAELGIEFRKGIEAAFHIVNTAGLTQPTLFASANAERVNITLISYDDMYETDPAAANTQRLIEVDKVFALIGPIGTPTTLAALPIATQYNIPILGAVTGSMTLRSPYNANIVNVTTVPEDSLSNNTYEIFRASYNDETAAMVDYLTKQLGFAKISIFYQNDSFGVAGYNGLTKALQYAGLTLESEGLYTRNTVDVEGGLENITYYGNPQAVVMVGTYQPLAKFVKLGKATEKLATAVFLTVSFVGSESFRDELDGVYDNIIVTQVVPLPQQTSLEVVRNYHGAMMSYSSSLDLTFDPAVNSTFLSLEGYMLGQLVIMGLQRMTGSFDVENFLTAIYDSAIFDMGDMRIGPYGPDCTSSITGCKCNQGMHEVYPTAISPTGQFHEIQDPFSFSTCGYTPPTYLPVAFGQSLQFSALINDTEQQEFRNGIKASFEEFNNANTFPRSILLITFANSTSTSVQDYSAELVSRGAFALIGDTAEYDNIIRDAEYASSANVPLIGAMSGAIGIRHEFNRNAVNIRPSYYDEAAAAVSFILSNNFTEVAVFYMNNSWCEDGKVGIDLALNAAGLEPVVTIVAVYEDGAHAFAPPNALKIPSNIQAVLVVGTDASALVSLVTALRQTSDPSFIFLSTVSIGQMEARLKEIYPIETATGDLNATSPFVTPPSSTFNQLYFTQATPSVHDTSSELAQSYLAAMKAAYTETGFIPSQVSLEGYLVGKFATMVLSRVDSTVSTESFLNTVYLSGTFLVSDILLGPFSNDSTSLCNQGLHDVYLLQLDGSAKATSVPTFTFHMDTCGVDYATIAITVGVMSDAKWVFVAIAFMGIVCAVCLLCVVFICRKLRVVRAKSEVYCVLLCLGVMIALSSVIVKGWDADTKGKRDRQCMAGAWTMLIGYSVTMSCLLASSISIYMQFRKKVLPSEVMISGYLVGGVVAVVTSLAMVVIIVYTATDPLRSQVKHNNDGYYYMCSSKYTNVWMAVIYSMLGVMGATNACISYVTRHYQTTHISVFIGYSVYNGLFLAVIILPIRLLVVSTPLAAYVLESIGFLFGAAFTCSTTLGIPLYNEFFGISKLLTTAGAAPTWGSSAYQGSSSSSSNTNSALESSTDSLALVSPTSRDLATSRDHLVLRPLSVKLDELGDSA